MCKGVKKRNYNIKIENINFNNQIIIGTNNKIYNLIESKNYFNEQDDWNYYKEQSNFNNKINGIICLKKNYKYELKVPIYGFSYIVNGNNLISWFNKLQCIIINNAIVKRKDNIDIEHEIRAGNEIGKIYLLYINFKINLLKE